MKAKIIYYSKPKIDCFEKGRGLKFQLTSNFICFYKPPHPKKQNSCCFVSTTLIGVKKEFNNFLRRKANRRKKTKYNNFSNLPLSKDIVIIE